MVKMAKIKNKRVSLYHIGTGAIILGSLIIAYNKVKNIQKERAENDYYTNLTQKDIAWG
tara:strand:+ start:185 stop:361 length:177 start_codon:yes stop_codon:yes gene_type:complete